MQLAIHDAREYADDVFVFPRNRNSNLTHLCFRVNDLAALVAALCAHSIDIVARDEVTVTAVDPDGRRVLLGTA